MTLPEAGPTGRPSVIETDDTRPRATTWWEVPLSALLFYLALFPLPLFLLVVGGIVTPLEYFFYENLYWVFPEPCLTQYPGYGCDRIGGVLGHWPFFVWGLVAIGFAWSTRGQEFLRKFVTALLLILATILFFHLFVAAMGWSVFIDTL